MRQYYNQKTRNKIIFDNSMDYTMPAFLHPFEIFTIIKIIVNHPQLLKPERVMLLLMREY